MPEVPNFKNYVADVVREEKAAKPDYTDPLLEVDLANLVPLPDLSDSPDGVWNGEYLSRSDPGQSFAVPIAIDLDPTKFYTLLIDVEFDSTETRPDGSRIYIETMKSDNTLSNWSTLYYGEMFVGRRTLHLVLGPGLGGWDYNLAQEDPETRMFFEFDSSADPKIYSVTLFEGNRSAFIEIGDSRITVADDGSLQTPSLIVDGTRLPKVQYGSETLFIPGTAPGVNPFTVGGSAGMLDSTVLGWAAEDLPDGFGSQETSLVLEKSGIYRIQGAVAFAGDVTDRILRVMVNSAGDTVPTVVRGIKYSSPNVTEFAFSEVIILPGPDSWIGIHLFWLTPGPVTTINPVSVSCTIQLKLEIT